MTSSLAAPAEKTKPAGPSFLARWYNALLESRHQAALREIEENYRAASLTDVAAAFHVGLPYLSAEVKRATGSTFKELLLHKRLDKAVRLLRETRLTIQEVCAAVGYDNTSYFHRVFRRRYGKSPKEYRSELWKTENAT